MVQASSIWLSVITILLTVIFGLVGLAYRDIRSQMLSIRTDQIRIANRQNLVVRVTFKCLSKLHPDKAGVINDSMGDLFATNGNGDMAKSAGAGS